jgi:DNA polymerase/3'-5' exonuclease PolX
MMYRRAEISSSQTITRSSVDRLASLAQLLSAQKENPWKVKAYSRAAAKIRTTSYPYLHALKV